MLDRIYQQADKVGRMDSNLITYLRESDRHYTETRKTKKTRETKQTREAKQTQQTQ
jgi:hypothetical protein